MAFNDFKSVEQVLQKYPLQIKRERFLPEVRLELPALFMENLDFALKRQAAEESEVFFRESYIFPFLQQAWKRHPKLKLWINQTLRYDETLSGEPDYFVSASTEGQIIDKLVKKPLLAVAEAKRQDFEGGWAQCLSELIACQKINADEQLTLYGIVSTGIFWEFGKLAKDIFTRDMLSATTADPQRVFGILDFIFMECEKQLQ
jgi:hypothetical protein